MPALTHSPARLQILLLPCASRHTCDDYHDESLTRVASSAFADTCYEQAAKPEVLGTRLPRQADGPQSTTSRSATNRLFFFPHFLVRQASFFDGVKKSGSCQTLIDVPPYHHQAKVCTAMMRERERERASQVRRGFPKSPNFRMFNFLISLFGEISPKTILKNKEKIRQGCSRHSPLFFCSFSFKFVLRRTLPLNTVIKH